MSLALHPRAGDLAKALREQAPPREIARILTNSEPRRDPVTFRSISGAMEARLLPGASRYGGRPVLTGTHSATNTQDLHGTWWARSALEEMRESALDRLSIWLNHEYRIPEDLLGTAVDATLEERVDQKAGTAHTDLDIATLVMPENVNPRAMQSYRAVEAGAKLGQSVGVFILDWEWQAPDGTRLADVEEDWCGPIPYEGDEPDPRLMITSAMMVESSLVGIPSNRRGWAQEATRALRRAGVLPPVGVEREARKRAHYLGASVGRVTREMVAQGHKAAAQYLADAGLPYERLNDGLREQMARHIIRAVKEETPMSEGAPLPEAVIRDQSERITRIADAGCETAPIGTRVPMGSPETRAPEQRSTNVEQENAAAGPGAARCMDSSCDCSCKPGAPDANCSCDCAECRSARDGQADSAAEPAPGGDPVGEAGRGDQPDATLAVAGRSLDELDAALNGAGGIVTGPAPEPEPAERDAPEADEAPEDRARRKAEKRAAKEARRQQEAAAQPAATAVEIALASEQLSALQAEIAAARAVRDELAAESKALRKAAKKAARAIADADQTGLYRPTRRADALSGVDLAPKSLVAMDDAEALAALRLGVPA